MRDIALLCPSNEKGLESFASTEFQQLPLVLVQSDIPLLVSLPEITVLLPHPNLTTSEQCTLANRLQHIVSTRVR
jgi:hypothetical protein